VARAVSSDPKRHTAYEPLYDIDPQTGASVEIFYADRALTKSFGARAGWFWWACQPGFLPGTCRLAHLPPAMPRTAISRRARQHAALKGLDETANAER
jgi:hypothetical protein